MVERTVVEDLLAPISVPAFVSEYFGKRALHIRGHETKLSSIYSLERFQRVLQETTRDVAARRAVRGRAMTPRAIFDRRWENGAFPQLEIEGPQAASAYASGATVCVASLDAADPSLGLLCQKMKSQLGFAGEVAVNAYWSPDGCGFGQHFDGRVVTTLQLAGKKRWRFSKHAAVEWPMDNGNAKDGTVVYRQRRERDPWELELRAMKEDDFCEVVLEPGDVLCLPAGAWHSAEAHGSSFALNLNFNPMPVGAFLGELLDYERLSDARFRCVPPLLGEHGVFGGMSRTAAVEIRARIDSIIEELGTLRDNPELIALRWAKVAAQELPPPAPAENIDEGSLLAVNETTIVITAPDALRCIVMSGPDELTATGATATVLKCALRTRRFRAGALVVPQHTGDAVLAHLRALVRAGVLEVIR